MLNRETYWQCAYVIPKGAGEQVKQKGLEAFREEIVKLSPFLSDRVAELHDWNDVSLLTVAVDRLSRWAMPGLLCNRRRGARRYVSDRWCRELILRYNRCRRNSEPIELLQNL